MLRETILEHRELHSEMNVTDLLRRARQKEAVMLAEAEPLSLTTKDISEIVARQLEQNGEAREAITRSRQEIIATQLGLSQKGVFIAGQCAPDSRLLADGRVPALEVPLALHTNAQDYSDTLVNLSRVCWKKPRSSTGSPGLYHQLSGPEFALREIYLPLIKSGTPFAYELLDPDDPLQYAASYAWLGARSVGHNSLWYAMAANPTCPVGLKNGEGGGFKKVGDVSQAIRANTAANLRLPTTTEAHVTTAGNQFINAIYRGGELNGLGLTDPLDIRLAFQQSYLQFCKEAYQAHTKVLLDCSHGNAKLFSKGARSEQGQLDCFDAFEELMLENPVIVEVGEYNAPRNITVLDMTIGVMAEINLLPGRNEPGRPALPGRSDVDACLALEQGFELQKRLAALYELPRPTAPIWQNHPALTQ